MVNLEAIIKSSKKAWEKHGPGVKRRIQSFGSLLAKGAISSYERGSSALKEYGPPVARATQKGINTVGPYVLANLGVMAFAEVSLEGYQHIRDLPAWAEESTFYTAMIALNAGIAYPIIKKGVSDYVAWIFGKEEKPVRKKAPHKVPKKDLKKEKPILKTELNTNWYQHGKTAAILSIAALGYYHNPTSDYVGNGIDRITDDSETLISLITEDRSKPKDKKEVTTDTRDKTEKDSSKKKTDPEASTAEGQGNEALEDSITRYVNGLRADGKARARGIEDYSIYVKDLHSGATVADINSGTQRMSASTIKLYVLAAAFQAIEDGKFEYTKSVKHDMEQMIRVSSNASTNRLIKKIGLENMNAYARNHGYSNTVVEYIPGSGRTLNNKTSAADLANVLAHIYKKDIPYATEMQRIMGLKSPGHLDRILDRTCIPNDKNALKISGGYVSSVKDKTGFIWGVNADAGLVNAHFYNKEDTKETNVPYIAVFMIEDEGASPAKFRGNANAWGRAKTETIRSISEAVYWHLERTYSDVPAHCREHKGVHPK